MKRQDSSDQAYQDFKQQFLYETMPKVAFRREPDLKKVDQPEILGDIMKANWSTEGDRDAIRV